MKKTLKILEWSIFASLLVLLFVAASPLLKNKAIVNTFVVPSGSMEPAIKTGSIAVTKPIDASQVKEGDIITFSSPDKPDEIIIHRVIKIDSSNNTLLFQTKGDNNNAEDSWTVTPSMIKGKGVLYIPYLGYFITYLKTVKGFVIGLGIPALVLAFLQIKKIKEGINEEVDRKTKLALEKHVSESKSKSVSQQIIVLLITGVLLPAFLVSTQKAAALFSAQVQITGLTLAVADFSAPPELKLELYDSDHKAKFILLNVAKFTTIEYVLRYKGKGDKWEDAIEGVIDNSSNANELTVQDLILGTCSDEVCVYAADYAFPDRLHQVFLDVTLRNEDEEVVLKTKVFADKK